MATRQWIEQHQVSELSADVSAPGFDQSWLEGVQQIAKVELVKDTPELQSASIVSTAVSADPNLRLRAKAAAARTLFDSSSRLGAQIHRSVEAWRLIRMNGPGGQVQEFGNVDYLDRL